MVQFKINSSNNDFAFPDIWHSLKVWNKQFESYWAQKKKQYKSNSLLICYNYLHIHVLQISPMKKLKYSSHLLRQKLQEIWQAFFFNMCPW